MTKKKKDKDKITDITDDNELTEKDMDQVSGGRIVRRPPIMGGKSGDDCGGNCMGSVPTSTGKDIDV